MSELIKKEVLSDEYINQVRTFGALSYTPERICRLLGLKGAKRTTLLTQNSPKRRRKERLMPSLCLKNARMNVKRKTCA